MLVKNRLIEQISKYLKKDIYWEKILVRFFRQKHEEHDCCIHFSKKKKARGLIAQDKQTYFFFEVVFSLFMPALVKTYSNFNTDSEYIYFQ